MRRGLVAAVAASGVLLTACNGSSARHADPKPTTPAPTATPTPSPTLRPGLLTLDDLPAGFTTRPLDSRNLPSNLTGCPAVERLLDGGLGEHTQAEFFQPPVGPWIDEAIIRPRGEAATATAARIATAIDGCDAVTVTEEGHRVTLDLTRAQAQGRDVHAYTAIGTLRGLGLRMDIVLAPAGRTVVLLTNAALAMTMNPGLTAQATDRALRKAALV